MMRADIKLIHGDCMEAMKEIPDNSIDLILTSPPYNKNGFRGRKDTSKGKGRWSGADIKYNSYDDNMKEEEYKSWQISILNEGYRIIRPTGSFLYNHKIRRFNSSGSHPFEWIQNSRLTFYQQIIWDRCGSCDHNVNYLDPTTEIIFWLTKKKPMCNKTNKKFSTEIWRFPPDNNTEHPAPFPLKLAHIAINMTTPLYGKVFDPFVGSGTSAIACWDTKRHFIGSEIDKDYYNAAKLRLERHQAQGQLF